MQTKLANLVASENALAELAQADVSARLSFTLALVLREVGNQLEAKRAAHQKLLEKYGAPIAERRGTYDIALNKRAAFEREYADLLDTDVTLTGIGKIRASALDAEGIKLSGSDAVALLWLVKEDMTPLFEE